MDIITLAMAKKAGGGGGIPITKVSDLVNDAGYITQEALAPYATQSATETALTAKANAADVTAALALKADASAVTAQIAEAIGGITSFEYYLCGNGEYDPVSGEPTVADADTQHIYLVPTSGTNLNMYAYIDEAFTFLGTTEVDLDGYATTAAMNAALALKADAADVPTVPTNVGAFANDAGYITNPRTTGFTFDCKTMEHIDGGGYIGNLNSVYGLFYEYITQEEYEAIAAVLAEPKTYYLGSELQPGTLLQDAPDYYLLGNAKETETGATFGMDCIDNTKPMLIFGVGYDDDESKYLYTVISSEDLSGKTVSVYSEGAYLTQHQSLSAYATKAEVTTALSGKSNTGHTHDDRYYTETEVDTKLGNKSNVGHTHAWSEITGKPYVVTGSAKAYSIVVSESAPADGTADSVITIVV